MAGSFRQIGTNIWAEESIRSLTRDQQRAYLLVYTQPELSRCGVLPFRTRRLGKLAADDSPKTLRKALAGLERTRHIVVDEDAEELFLRTFVRHDGLLAQPQVVAAMVSDYHLIESGIIRTAFLSELRRIWDLDDLPDNQRRGLRLALGEHDNDRFTDKIGLGLAPAFTAAFDAGSLPPFDPASPQGCPAPFAKAHAGARAPSPAPTPAPTPAAAAPASTEAARRSGPANTLLDKHQADHGELPTLTLNALAEIIVEAQLDGATDAHVLTALTDWRGRLRPKPGLLRNLIADARQADATSTSSDDALEDWVRRKEAERATAAGGSR